MLTWVALALFAAALIFLLMHRRYRTREDCHQESWSIPILVLKTYRF